MTAKGIVELLIPARGVYRLWVRTVGGAGGAVGTSRAAEGTPHLRLVVSEAATNAIYAQAAAGVEDRIVVRCNLAAEQIEIEVNDRGAGFDPDEVRSLPAAESPKRLEHESGLGISLMRRLADETTIETSVDGTVVRLVVRFLATGDET